MFRKAINVDFIQWLLSAKLFIILLEYSAFFTSGSLLLLTLTDSASAVLLNVMFALYTLTLRSDSHFLY